MGDLLCDDDSDDDSDYSGVGLPRPIGGDEFRNHPVSWDLIQIICGWKPEGIMSEKLMNIELSGVDTKDYPDFSDAYIAYAEYANGTPLTDNELGELDGLAQSMALESLIQ